jgi:hypothetical protein
MPLILNPYVLAALEWGVRKGAPLLMSRLSQEPATEEVIFQGLARLQRGTVAVDGLLSVTPTHLVFSEAGGSGRRLRVQVPVHEIEDVTLVPRRRFGLISTTPNTINVRSRRGTFLFVVDAQDSDRWVRELRAASRSATIIDVAAR